MESSQISLNRKLIDACLRANSLEVEALLALGADPNSKNRPLSIGYWEERAYTPAEACLQLLNNDELSPKMAARLGCRLLNTLHQHGADLNQGALWVEATLLEEAETIRHLAEIGGVPTQHAADIVTACFLEEKFTSLGLIQEIGIDINLTHQHRRHPLLLISVGQISLPAPTNEQGKTLESRYLSLFTRLRAQGINLDIVDEAGATPLMRSLAAGMHTLARALVRAGANVRHTMHNGVSALHLAAYCAPEEMVQFLLANNATLQDLAKLDASSLSASLGNLALSARNI